MLTFNECLSYCGLTQDEIDVIARCEKITGLAAIAFAHYELHTREGEQIGRDTTRSQDNA